MRIEFGKNTDYLEIKKGSEGKIVIILSAVDSKNSLSSIVNSVEVNVEDFEQIMQHIGFIKKT